MSVPALLLGVADRLAGVVPDDNIGVRPGGNGRPAYGFQGKAYVGVYFAGGRTPGSGSVEDFELEYTVGVDVTWTVAAVPTRKRGEFVVEQGKLLDLAGLVAMRLMKGDSAVRNLCQAHLGELKDAGTFFENFDSCRFSPTREESPGWLGREADDTKCPSILVATVTASGLKYHRTLEGCP